MSQSTKQKYFCLGEVTDYFKIEPNTINSKFPFFMKQEAVLRIIMFHNIVCIIMKHETTLKFIYDQKNTKFYFNDKTKKI